MKRDEVFSELALFCYMGNVLNIISMLTKILPHYLDPIRKKRLHKNGATPMFNDLKKNELVGKIKIVKNKGYLL